MKAFKTVSLSNIINDFSGCFSRPSFENFSILVASWILCTGRHTISRVIQAMYSLGFSKHHSILYRFFSRAQWVTDEVGVIIFKKAVKTFGCKIVLMVDDTLCHKSGPHIFGAGMHHDSQKSTYGRGAKSKSAHKAFAFGHNWVVLTLWLPAAWWHSGGIAIPVLFRLYRQKKRCPAEQYSKRTLLAKELIDVILPHVPNDRKVILTGDSEYACKSLVRPFVGKIDFIGPITLNAAIYDMPIQNRGRGRKRVKGKRLPTPQKIIDMANGWTTNIVNIYGREVTLLTKSYYGMWYTVSGSTWGKVVVTKDPSGRLQSRAFFTTNPDLSSVEIIELFSRRWEIEVAFRNVKQHLGIEDPQNGWWRRKKNDPIEPKKAGPNPRGSVGKGAVEKTFPFVFYIYAITILWFQEQGNPAHLVAESLRQTPWCTNKTTPSYADILVSLRRELWAYRISRDPLLRVGKEKILKLLPRWILAA